MTLAGILALSLLAPQSPTDPAGPSMEMSAVIGSGSGELKLTEAGQPVQDLAGLNPNWSWSAVLGGVPAGMGVNSFSAGTGLLPVEWVTQDQWRLVSGMGGYWWVVYGVSGSFPSGTVYAEEDGTATGTAGDMFQFHSDTFTVFKVNEGETIGMSSTRGIDTYLPAVVLEDFIPEDVPMRLYFTLRGDFSQVSATWVSNWSDYQSAAEWQQKSTIFVVEYVGSAWTQPRVHRIADQLGIPASSTIDGLSICSDGLILYSLDAAGPAYELRVSGPEGNSALYTTAGAVLAQQMGFTDSGKKLVGLCSEDPMSDGTVELDEREEKRIKRNSVNRMPLTSVGVTVFQDVDAVANRYSAATPTRDRRDRVSFLFRGYVRNAVAVRLRGLGEPESNLYVNMGSYPLVGTSQRPGVVRANWELPREWVGSDEVQRFLWEVLDKQGQVLGVSREIWMFQGRARR